MGPSNFNAKKALLARLTQSGYWAAFLFVLVPYTGLNLWTLHKEGGLGTFLAWLPEVIPAGLYLCGMVWLSPWCVQIGQGHLKVRRFLYAFGFAELYMCSIIPIELGLRAIAGKSFVLNAYTLGLHAAFHAPAMILVGLVLDARERLHGENQDIRSQAREAQAKVLQGQLNPHVLFNAMNGLAELVHKNSPLAEESIRHISALLRKVLNATEQPAYTVGDERELLEDYLHMERIRLGDRLRLSWHWDRNLDPLPMAPLLLQPLVENALKHGIAPSEEGGEVEIIARREGRYLVIEIRNTGLPLKSEHPEGVGTRNLRARMELIYPKTYSFSLHREGDLTVATLRLEQQALHFGDGTAPGGVGGRRGLGPGTAVETSH